jgi:hypothetical protein
LVLIFAFFGEFFVTIRQVADKTLKVDDKMTKPDDKMTKVDDKLLKVDDKIFLRKIL